MHNLKHIYHSFTCVIGLEVHLLLTEFCNITVEIYFFVSHTVFTVHVMNSGSVVTWLCSEDQGSVSSGSRDFSVCCWIQMQAIILLQVPGALFEMSSEPGI